MHDAIVAGLGILGGYVVSRICWARKVDERLTRHDTWLRMLLNHFGLKTGDQLDSDV